MRVFFRRSVLLHSRMETHYGAFSDYMTLRDRMRGERYWVVIEREPGRRGLTAIVFEGIQMRVEKQIPNIIELYIWIWITRRLLQAAITTQRELLTRSRELRERRLIIDA